MHRRRWSGSIGRYVIEADGGDRHLFPLSDFPDTEWREALGGRVIPAPGVRLITAEELAASDLGRQRGWGKSWRVVPRDSARAAEPFLAWCQRQSNRELESGDFLFDLEHWSSCRNDVLMLPFVPELDHPDHAIQRAAAAERERQILLLQLRDVDRRRQAAVREASKRHSRRALGAVLGLSWARIQQLVQER